MTSYLLENNGKYTVITSNKEPSGYVCTVPDNIDKADYKYIRTTPVYDLENGGIIGYNVSIDSDKKAADQIIIEQAKYNSAMSDIRNLRDLKLLETDFTQISDAPMSPELVNLYAVYRQELRDFPGTVTDPYNPVWPISPEA